MSELLQLREPGGVRVLTLPCWIAGQPESLPAAPVDQTILLPGLPPATRLQLSWDIDALYLAVDGDAVVRCNGIRLQAGDRQRLQLGDVLSVESTQIRLTSVAPLVVEICHLEGNQTLEPSALIDTRASPELFVDERIETKQLMPSFEPVEGPPSGATGKHRTRWLIAAVVASLAGVAIFLSQLERIELRVLPQDAKVGVDGVGWRAGESLLVWPGKRTIRISKSGYESLVREVLVQRDQALALDLRLQPLPGILEIDTAGVTATAYVDGAEIGVVPGELSVPEGERTLTLRADKHLDAVTRLEVKGRGLRQPLSIRLQPSWGALDVSATQAATLEVEGQSGTWQLPSKIELPAGLHRVSVSAPNTRRWQSAVLIEAGRTTTVGPLQLGAPDAEVRVSSRPTGATVMVGGVFRGRTPLVLELPPGMEHEVSLTLDGYRGVDRRVRAEPGSRTAIALELSMQAVSLQLDGQPTDVEVWLGEARLGVTPLTVELPARRHTLELRKTGSATQRLDVDLSNTVARRIDYRLVPEGKAADWTPPTPQWRGQSGTVMRLVNGGSFLMGSDRREQGRRANEYQRRITLSRPFYFAIHEVTNAEFRRFKADHSSGFLGKRTLDLDSFAVSGVSWQEAVQYCNWLSERDGLPPAYEQRQGRWVLREPVTIGYRLPTEAEWEFVARQAGTGGAPRRYEWGNSLPPPRNFANLAGDEVVEALPRVLPGWQDEYPVVAPPGRFVANPLGIFDLTGNVSEWIHDTYSPVDTGGATIDPFGPAPGTRHVVKGASWRTSAYADLRVGWRDGLEGAAQDVGFRVVRYAE